MGEVWEAKDSRLDRRVAVKLLKGHSPEDVARFRREAQLAAKLSHPNVASVYDAGDDYIAMQFIEGPTLEHFPRRSPRQLCELVRQAALGVHAAHLEGVIHRDLKPGNVLVENGRAIVTDFGLAKSSAVQSSLSVSGLVVGTPSYMSPEQARGQKVDERTDVYSLGATLYELLEGRPPFQGRDIYEVLRKVIEDEPAPPHVDIDLQTIVLKCLDKEPDRRYRSAQALARDLERFLAGEAVLARRAGWIYRLGKRIRRNLPLSIAVASAAVILLASGALLLKGRVDRSSELRSLERRADELREESRRRHEAKDWSGAQETLAQYLALRPGDAEARRMKEECAARLAEQKDQAGATADVQESAERCRAALELVKEAKMLWRTRNARPEQWQDLLDRAADAVGSAIDRYPRLAGNHYVELAGLQMDADVPECIRSCGRALQIDSSHVPAYQMRALAYNRLGDPGSALRDCDRAIELRPNDAASYGSRAVARENLGDIAGALADYAKSMELDPDDPTGHSNLANLYLSQGRYREAVEEASQAIQRAPEWELAWYNRGNAWWQLEEWKRAGEDFSKAIELDPEDWAAYWSRGYVRTAAGDLRGAISDFDEAIRRNRVHRPSWVNRAYAKRAADGAEAARADVEEILRKWPGVVEEYLALAEQERASGRGRFAVRHADRVLLLEPSSARGWAARGRGHHACGDYRKALEDLRKAVELDGSLARELAPIREECERRAK